MHQSRAKSLQLDSTCAAQQLDLVWNDVVIAGGDSLAQTISRGIILTITFNPSIEKAAVTFYPTM
jgi:hypothetical protein